jgi:chemotaxis protein methyltransferase CheR
VEKEVYAQVKHIVKKLLDINLDYYKDEQMKRRLDSWLVRVGAHSWPEYFKRLQTDEIELGRFRDYLTINVSSFFRDPERWLTLRQKVVPDLLESAARRERARGNALPVPHLRIWSAGCSIGMEPYSLAILLEELTSSRRHYLLATDLDRGALAKARARGPYTPDEVNNMSAPQRAKHFQPGGPPFFIAETLAKRVEFRELDLLADAFAPDMDLIVCRNVVIYFTEEAKAMLYRRFFEALRPGGVLFVGGTEVISHSSEIGFRSYGISFYQRPE